MSAGLLSLLGLCYTYAKSHGRWSPLAVAGALSQRNERDHMKKIRLSLIVIAAAFGLEAAAAAGDSVVWTNVAKKSASWLVAGNWTDGSGNPLAAAPAGGENITIVDVPELPAHNSYINDADILGDQTISYPVGTDVFSLSMGEVSGDSHHTIAIGTDGSSANGSSNYAKQYVTIGDPTGFLGFWRIAGMEMSVTSLASASLTPVFHNFSAKHNPVLNGSDSAGTIVIDALYDAGAISKAGAGALRVKATSGEQMVVYQKGGKLVLDGSEDGALADILAAAALHLDASVDASLVKKLADDGLVSVSKWKDVRGGEDRSYFVGSVTKRTASHEIKSTNPPFLSDAAKSPTGLPLVDFGARSNYGLSEFPERGRTNCMMRLCKDDVDTVLQGVREVFYAVSSPKGADSVQILGASGSINYMCTDGTALFNSMYSDPAVRHGDIIFNTRKHAYNGFAAQELTDLYTLGIGVGRDTSVSYLGTRQYYANATGGSRMGEIILFTNDLTRAERMMVCRYLDAKWRTGDAANNDLMALHSTSSSPTVEVPEAGKTVRIGNVAVSSSKVLNKTGDGTLVVGRMTSDTTVNVQGGKVEFSGIKVADDAVAANPYVHLDAADIGAGDVEVVDGVSYVNYWNDKNYGAERRAKAAALDVTGPAKPTLIDSPIACRKVVDFGAHKPTDSTGAWMKLCNWGDTSSHQAYAGFIVLRAKATSKACPHFGSSQGMTFYRSSYQAILSPSYKNAILGAAVWRVNGEIEPPFTSGSLNNVENFKVLSFSSGYPVQLDALVADKGGQSSVKDSGGFEIGEVVVYDRQLTEQEIVSTESYLMKKWLGTGIPNGVSVAEMTVDVSNSPDLAGDDDLVIGKLTGGNGSIVKSGDGSALVRALTVTPTSIAVSGGELTIPSSAAKTFLDDAVFHIDASRLDTLTYTVDGSVTNVSSWADVRGNGWVAQADSDALATQKPRLVTAETAPGSGKYITALDFGDYSWRTNEYSEVNGSASMQMLKNGKLTAVAAQEAITVFADVPAAGKNYSRASVFGHTGSHDFQRNWSNGQMYFSDNKVGGIDCQVLKASSIVRNATSTRMDGNDNVASTKPAAGFHYFDFVASKNGRNPMSGWGAGGAINAIARVYGSSKANNGTDWGFDYDIEWEDRGGIRIAEQMAFTRILTADEAAYVKALLDSKWLGGPHPGYLVTNAMDSISVAAGSTLVLMSRAEVMPGAAELSGEGTIETDVLAVTDRLGVTVANGKTEHLVVSGKVEFDGSLTVDVTADLTNGRISQDRYPILTAAEFVGFDDTTFSVNILTDRSGIYSARVVRYGDTLYLQTTKSGFMMLVR